jgi:hypothetical protein
LILSPELLFDRPFDPVSYRELVSTVIELT